MTACFDPLRAGMARILDATSFSVVPPGSCPCPVFASQAKIIEIHLRHPNWLLIQSALVPIVFGLTRFGYRRQP
jgi:hypothetical protein